MILSEDEILKMARAIPAIYKITNLANGKYYVGSTTNYRLRRIQHFSELRCNRHNNPHLQRAFNKYGESQFKIEMLTPITPDELEFMERGFIEWLDAANPSIGYNVLKGGGRRPSKPWGRPHLSEESKQRISKAKLGQKYSDRARANMSKGQKLLYASGYQPPNKGKPMSDTQRAKLKDAWTRRTNRSPNKGRRFAPEHMNAFLSAAHQANKKAILHIGRDGVVIQEYSSIKDAVQITKRSHWAIWSSAARGSRQRDGSRWEYKPK